MQYTMSLSYIIHLSVLLIQSHSDKKETGEDQSEQEPCVRCRLSTAVKSSSVASHFKLFTELYGRLSFSTASVSMLFKVGAHQSTSSSSGTEDDFLCA